jgi:fermentation-respiration switch protein FrsA (DUF1100 family)
MFSTARPLIWVTAATLGLSGVAAAAANGVSALLVYTYARPRRVWGTGEPPAGLAEEVAFESPEDSMPLRGWFLPAATASRTTPGSTLVLCHGVWTGRRECLPLALRFQAVGYNVLCFDFRAHGESGGSFISLGHNETRDVLGAVRWLADRPEVDRRRIGVLGFSMGAAAALQAAARCQDIAAVAADSGYAELVDAVRYSFRRVGRLPHYPFGPLALYWARVMLRVDARHMRPIDEVGRIAPRPLLLLHGAEDEIVPVSHARRLFQAADEPKDLWIEPGQGHVGARDCLPDTYFARVEAFFREALAVGAGSRQQAAGSASQAPAPRSPLTASSARTAGETVPAPARAGRTTTLARDRC